MQLMSYYHGDFVMRIIERFELNFALGCVVKYVLRAGRKRGEHKTYNEAEISDLEKALWYLQRELTRLKRANR